MKIGILGAGSVGATLVIALALAWDVADSTAPEYQITYVVAPFNSLICRMAPPKARTFNYQVN